MHGPWHPILHNAARSLKDRDTQPTGTQYAPVIPNDYTWYRPLDRARKEIRILFIEPEPLDSDKDVVVHVFNASLLDPTVPRLYGCLSYCWGDPSVTKTIQVMYSEKPDLNAAGLVTTKTNFRVTTNLEAALRVLRSILQRPVMWADAICIDQSDLDERSSQVPLMTEIYTQAVQTVIWLGDADSTTKRVFDFADLLTKMEVKPHEVDPNTMAAGIQCERLRPLAKGQLQFFDHELLSDEFYKMRWGIQALLARPFFRRAWVLQEIGLADRDQIVVHCGQSSLWWLTFLNLTTFEWRAAERQGRLEIDSQKDARLGLPTQNPAMRPGVNYKLPEIWGHLNRYSSNTMRGNILDLVFRRLEVEATDPRDHVYALFGLARECVDAEDIHSGFRADYSRDLAAAYTLFTRAIVEKIQNLVILSNVDVFSPSPTRKERRLPTWVPEYDRHINLRQTLGFLGEGYYQASGKSKPNILHSHPEALLLSGIIVDQVGHEPAWGPYLMTTEGEDVNDSTKPIKVHMEGVQGSIGDLWRIASSRIKQNPIIGEDLLETFILTLICCRREHYNRSIINRVSDIPNLLVDFLAYWKMYCGLLNSLPVKTALYESHDQLSTLAEMGDASRFAQRLFYTCNKRSFLITVRGLMALVPNQTSSRDLVVVFEGANVPHVVRQRTPKIEGSNTKFEFIGECYLHGRMQGSTMLEVDRGILNAEIMEMI
jgi:hypothetical protein